MQKKSKKILITGASRGIGKDIALKSKAKGYEVLGTSTTNEGVSNLKQNGIFGLELDLNNIESVESFNDLLIQEHSDIAVLINNAGITRDNIVLRMKLRSQNITSFGILLLNYIAQYFKK